MKTVIIFLSVIVCASAYRFRAMTESDDTVYPDVDDLDLDFDMPDSMTGMTGATGMDFEDATGGYLDDEDIDIDDVSLEEEIEEEEEEMEAEDKPDCPDCQNGPITVHVKATANGGNAESHAAVIIGGDDSVHKSYSDFMSTLGLGDMGEDEDENMLVRTGGVAI